MKDAVDISTFDSLVSRDEDESFISSDLQDKEDVQRSYTFLTPNGMKVWCPISDSDARPYVGATYGPWDDVINMYKNYALKCGFSIRVGQTKKNKEDLITHKYLRCNKSGRPQRKRKFDTLVESSLHGRKSSF
ncbi:hypothetical protein R6Q57_002815 [Mikania cordata]